MVAQPSTRACITLREIAESYGIGQASTRKLAAEGVIPCLRIGRKLIIPRAAFEHWYATKATAISVPSRAVPKGK
ncbi:MAG: helix-turn-helix domain-containing protein [Bryobacteraceae bacterium]